MGFSRDSKVEREWGVITHKSHNFVILFKFTKFKIFTPTPMTKWVSVNFWLKKRDP